MIKQHYRKNCPFLQSLLFLYESNIHKYMKSGAAMNIYNVDLKSLLPKGHVISNMEDSVCHITATERISTNFEHKHLPVNSYVSIPNTFKLPFRIDLCIKIDTPEFYLFVGKGHVNFGSFGSDNRRMDDIMIPDYKPKIFHNHISLNEFVKLSIYYGFNAMEISVDNEIRYFSKKERYMKPKVLKEFGNPPLEIKLSCSKHTNLLIKSIAVTEYDKDLPALDRDASIPIPVPITRNEAVPLGEKPSLETCISLLPDYLQKEIISTDLFLRSLSPMRFKRQIEKNGNKISYIASDYGFSYHIYPSSDRMYHSLSWYIITSSKPENWHRKADYMEAALNHISDVNLSFAEKMFANLKECIGCCPCIVKTPYTFCGKTKISCHGLMDFKMHIDDFEDVRYFIRTINDLV